jgi:hypothetical protein
MTTSYNLAYIEKIMADCDKLVFLEQTDSYYRTIKKGCIFNEGYLSASDRESECIKYMFGDNNKEGEFGTIIILQQNLHNADIVEASKRWMEPPVLCNIYTCKHLSGIPNIDNPNIYKFTFTNKHTFSPGENTSIILGHYQLYGVTHVYYCKRCMTLRFAIWNKYYQKLPETRIDGLLFFSFDLDEELKKNPEITYKNCKDKNKDLPKIYDTRIK